MSSRWQRKSLGVSRAYSDRRQTNRFEMAVFTKIRKLLEEKKKRLGAAIICRPKVASIQQSPNSKVMTSQGSQAETGARVQRTGRESCLLRLKGQLMST